MRIWHRFTDSVNEESEEKQGWFRPFFAWLNSAEFLTRFHGTATFIWLLLIFPSVTWWKDSVPYLVLISVWANLASHWSAYQASRAERLVGEEDRS